MDLKSLPYKWTYFLGFSLLVAVFWSGTFLDGLSFFALFLFGLCFLIGVVVSVSLVLLERTKVSVYRLLMNVAVCVLAFPVGKAATLARDQLFRVHMARFQEATNLLIENERPKVKGDDFRTGVQLPPKYLDLNVGAYALINFTKEGVTVRYTTRDSSALGH